MDLEKLSAQLHIHEGLKLKPYVDTVGKVTIGVGHNLTDKGITPKQADIILTDDIKDVVDFLALRLPWALSLDEVRQRAMGDLTFDLMGKVLDFHHMLGALQREDWNTAADALLASKFATQVGKRVVDLSNMIRTGTDPT